MRFENETPFETLFTVGLGKDGRERVIVVTKASYRLPTEPAHQAAPLELAEVPRPLIEADEFEDDPGSSSPVLETDFAHVKMRCDVLFSGCAYGRGATEVGVGLRVGGWQKGFRVTGTRVWQPRVGGGFEPSAPLPFERMPLTYGRAYGGSEENPRKPGEVSSYRANPVGRGFHPFSSALQGLEAPNTEHPSQPITAPNRAYAPMALGPIGRAWEPRIRYTGTYDAAWLENRVPFLPEDFDEQYFQAAPPDQQIPFPRGGEPVAMVGLSANHECHFALPSLDVPVMFVPRKGQPKVQRSFVDTILFEPEHGTVSLTARTIYPTRRDAFELRALVVGATPRAMAKRRARLTGKTYYPRLSDAVRARRDTTGDRRS